ncbi:MAG: transcriptional regulator NrdR [Candidatus Moraniibacteriota bacterium]
MKCPFCNHEDTKVVDSRETLEGRAIRRRRECLKCEARFSTYEQAELFRVSVLKKDGRREPYERKKIQNGLRKAFEKRPMTEERLEQLMGEIEYTIAEKAKKNIIGSREIGNIVLDKLKTIDEVAYIRFASVYQSFGSARGFRRVLEKFDD